MIYGNINSDAFRLADYLYVSLRVNPAATSFGEPLTTTELSLSKTILVSMRWGVSDEKCVTSSGLT